MQHGNLSMVKGNSKVYQLEFKKDGAAVNITGWKVFFTVKSGYGVPDSQPDIEAIIRKDITSHSDPTNGKTLIQLSYEETNLLPLGQTLTFDITVKDSSGNIQTILMGRVEVIEKVTLRTT